MASSLLFVLVVGGFFMEGYCLEAETNATVKDICIEQTNVSKELVDNYYEKETDNKEPPEGIDCYIHCVLFTIGIFDTNGTILVEQCKTLFPDVNEDCLKKIPKIEKCKDVWTLNDCNV